jgi:hypothetical protein
MWYAFCYKCGEEIDLDVVFMHDADGRIYECPACHIRQIAEYDEDADSGEGYLRMREAVFNESVTWHWQALQGEIKWPPRSERDKNRIQEIIESAAEKQAEIRMSHIEAMAGAYLLLTDIPPDEVELVEDRTDGFRVRWYFRRKENAEDDKI